MPHFKVKYPIIQGGKLLKSGATTVMTDDEARLLLRRGYLEKELKATKSTKELKGTIKTK